MSDARWYAVWPEPRSRSLKGSRPSVPHGTNFFSAYICDLIIVVVVVVVIFTTTITTTTAITIHSIHHSYYCVL